MLLLITLHYFSGTMMSTLLFLLMVHLAASSKILIVPNQESSHIRTMASTGRALADHGHQVTITVKYSQKQGPEIIGKMEQLFFSDPNEKVHPANSKEMSEEFFKNYRQGISGLKQLLMHTPDSRCIQFAYRIQ